MEPAYATDITKRSLGIYTDGEKVYFYSVDSSTTSTPTLTLEVSENGQRFHKTSNQPVIRTATNDIINPASISSFHISGLGHQFTLIFKSKEHPHLMLAVSRDLITWITKELPIQAQSGILIPQYMQAERQYLLFSDGKSIQLASSDDGESWKISKQVIMSLAEEQQTAKEIGMLGVTRTPEGIAVLYFERTRHTAYTLYSLHVVMLDKKKPEKVLWRLEKAFWHTPTEWMEKQSYPLGILNQDEDLLSYWDIGNGIISAVAHTIFRSLIPNRSSFFAKLFKHRENPILSPRDTHLWESQAVFNPAAVYDNGTVHLLYRAVGEKYVSVLGYAQSPDGIQITHRADKPVYLPREPFEGAYGHLTIESLYRSGPGWGGCEDPRLTVIDDRVYLVYVAFDGWSPPRVALSSIDLRDFRKKRWRWEKPVLISRPGIVNKNACLLPEKVRGKYVIFHRIFPNILVDYVDDLDFDGKTKWLKGDYTIKPSLEGWDSRKVGVGPPPLKTDRGWLLIYHAVDDKDDSQYKMGAMLLDLEHPEQVIARTKQPILTPNMWYENNGYKAGVAYPCGAVIIDDTLYVYYGGADSVICVATAKLDRFLDYLLHNEQITMEEAPSNQVPFV